MQPSEPGFSQVSSNASETHTGTVICSFPVEQRGLLPCWSVHPQKRDSVPVSCFVFTNKVDTNVQVQVFV